MESSTKNPSRDATWAVVATGRHSARVYGLAVTLVLVQLAMVLVASRRNAITVDEVHHLPAGISYWHHGRFWCYHHNPPLVRLLFALPAVLDGVPTDYRNYHYVPGSRAPDWLLGRDFMLRNQDGYAEIFFTARGVVATLSAVGGLLVFFWSRRLFGDCGGLISLALWIFCPNILANAGVASCDLGASVFGLLASYQFWRYLRAPNLIRACVSGLLLGLAEATKFSMVVLPLVWGALAVIKILLGRRAGNGDRLTARQALAQASALTFMSLLCLNDVYLFEGSGLPLGSFAFRSKLLTTEVRGEGPVPEPAVRRVNRFRGTALEGLPMPFPEHYLLGFDDQAYDVDSAVFHKYLRGQMRHNEKGWYLYYIYALLVKTPLGSLALIAASALVGISLRRCRSDLLSEAFLLLLPLSTLLLVSSQRGLNSHVRYTLPALPFVFIAAGRLGCLAGTSRAWGASILAALAATSASVLAVHPFYLSYFNEAAGGPGRGMEHLGESNIDWGQGLFALRDWLSRNAPRRTFKLAYYGTMYPEILGIAYDLPNFDPQSNPGEWTPPSARFVGPTPGLQAVSINFLLGFPFAAPNGRGTQTGVPSNAYVYFKKFKPLKIIAHSIYIFDISADEADRVRLELGLSRWSEILEPKVKD